MKKIFLSMALAGAFLGAHAQFDSSRVSVPLTLQMRDHVFIASVVSQTRTDDYDVYLDSLKARYRANPALGAGTGTLRIDSVERGTIMALFELERNMPTRYAGYGSRIDAAIEAMTDPWILRRVQDADARLTAFITAIFTSTLKNLKGQRY